MQDLTGCTVDREEATRGKVRVNILAHRIVKIYIPWESIGIGNNFIMAGDSIDIATTFDLIKVNFKCTKAGCIDFAKLRAFLGVSISTPSMSADMSASNISSTVIANI